MYVDRGSDMRKILAVVMAVVVVGGAALAGLSLQATPTGCAGANRDRDCRASRSNCDGHA